MHWVTAQTALPREKPLQNADARNLAQVDVALLSRTSNIYGVLTSDDPFQYLGGRARAVRQLIGEDPALYVQNLRDKSEVTTESASSAIAKEMQTRYLHPQWINAQKAEGYSGSLQVLKTAQFLWGWQVKPLDQPFQPLQQPRYSQPLQRRVQTPQPMRPIPRLCPSHRSSACGWTRSQISPPKRPPWSPVWPRCGVWRCCWGWVGGCSRGSGS